jgi:hypothetical protein
LGLGCASLLFFGFRHPSNPLPLASWIERTLTSNFNSRRN